MLTIILLLWGSTSTKNPDYSDVKYVGALIGPDTVNAAPLEKVARRRILNQQTASEAKEKWRTEGNN